MKQELKVGDKVKIIDGSYALRIGDRCVEAGEIGRSTDEFIVADVIDEIYVQRGVHRQGCIHDIVVEDLQSGERYLHTSRFVTLVKPKKIVKPLRELINTLLDEGYRPDSQGDWWRLVEEPHFTVEMFDHCGRVPAEDFHYKDSWLTTEES